MVALMTNPYLWLLGAIFVAAVLYSSVGHGGASGYLAAMALFGLSPETMKPAALTMNIFVAGIVLIRLHRAGHFDARLFVPIAIASVPMAFLGGAYTIDAPTYKYLVGAALLAAALAALCLLAVMRRDTLQCAAVYVAGLALVVALFSLEKLAERVLPKAAHRHRALGRFTMIVFLGILCTSALTYLSLYVLYQPHVLYQPRLSCG